MIVNIVESHHKLADLNKRLVSNQEMYLCCSVTSVNGLYLITHNISYK